MNQTFNQNAAIGVLNRILNELELAGVVRYTHYALMVYGYNRIPIVGWLNAQAGKEVYPLLAGELITSLGGHPSLGIGPLLETHQHDIGDILRESLAHEEEALKAYYDLLDCVQNTRTSGWKSTLTRKSPKVPIGTGKDAADHRLKLSGYGGASMNTYAEPGMPGSRSGPRP